jgi:hypothetical protein
MPKSSLALIGAVLIILLVGVAMATQRSQRRLLEMNAALQHQLSASKLASENRLLSNSLAQTRLVESSIQELVKLRSEVNRLRQEKDEFIETNQAQLVETTAEQLRELAAIREYIGGLGEEVFSLREAVQEFYAGALPPAAATAGREQPTPTERTRANEDGPMAIRIIETHGDAFAENLKQSASAAEGETFQEVFGRYLRAHGVDLGNVAGLVYDERTGRVIVRATPPAIEAIERLAVGLQQTE